MSATPMPQCCPTCGQSVPPPHGIIIEGLNVKYNERHARVTPSGAAILTLLLRRIGKTVYHEQILSHLYDARLEDPAGDGCVKALICKLRRSVAAIDLRIITDWGTGYRLDHPKLPPSDLCTVESRIKDKAA